ncbi:MAG: YwaF family protein [Erysipelotrichaceae bacterium]|nr:YwaF family protein [Erysipelotrichaceae bacterium]
MADIHIRVFNKGWWFYVLLTVVFLAVMTAAGRALSPDGRLRLVFWLSIFEYVILRIYKHSLRHIRDDYNFFNELPCYLCNQSTIICIIAAFTGSSILMSYCVTVGTIGALLAVFMPDRYNRDQLLFSKQAFGFYGYHGLLIITCLSFYTLGLYRPDPKDALWGMLITFLLAATAHRINAILRKSGLNKAANYVFTWGPDNAILDKLYSLFPVKLFYMIPVMLIFGAVSFIALLLLP